MQTFLIITIITLLLILLYLFCIAPNQRKEITFPFKDVYIAHRGLFDNLTESPENSISAFRKAVMAGYGIELDVRLTKDDKLVVFHDGSMQRMCGIDKRVIDCTYEEISTYKLADSKEIVPLFADVLKVIGGKVPLIVEIKAEGDWKKTTTATLDMLKAYNGEYCVESFNPLVLRLIRKNRPEIIRGQLSTDFFKDGSDRAWYEKIFLSSLMLNFISRPDFIAYNHKWKNQFSYRILRYVYGGINVAWTVKSQAELDSAMEIFDCVIFDSFIPKPDL